MTDKQRRALEAAEAGELIAKDGRRMSPNTVINITKGTATQLNNVDPETKRAVQQAGAAASNAKQAQRRTIAAIYNELLSMPDTAAINSSDKAIAEAAQALAQAKGRQLTIYEGIAIAQAVKASTDTRAAVFVRDSVGDKPADTVQLQGETITAGDRALMDKLAETMSK